MAIPGLVASLVKGKAKFLVEAAAQMKAADGQLFAVPMRWDGDLSLPKLPTVKVNALELGDIGLTEITLNLVLDVANPNAFPIPLEAVTGNLAVSRANVATILLPEAVALVAAATTPVTLPITISVADVSSDVIKQVRSGKATYDLTGQLKVGGKSLPFNYRTGARKR
jgi:LEA14-like dessication related protein